MATGTYEVKVDQPDMEKLQRMGWHFSECKKCGRQIMGKSCREFCELCKPPKRTFKDFIKLLFRY